MGELLFPPRLLVRQDRGPPLHYDIGSSPGRVVILGTPGCARVIQTAHIWSPDGTFKAAPIRRAQVYTLHARVIGFLIPCAYALPPPKQWRRTPPCGRGVIGYGATAHYGFRAGCDKCAARRLSADDVRRALLPSMTVSLPKRSAKRDPVEIRIWSRIQAPGEHDTRHRLPPSRGRSGWIRDDGASIRKRRAGAIVYFERTYIGRMVGVGGGRRCSE